jgi:hypothetical protein
MLVMEPGSLFILGHQTNKIMKHSIVPITKERLIKRTSQCGARISIVFRNIKTIIDSSIVKKKLKSSQIQSNTIQVEKIKIRLKPEKI